MRVPLNFTGFSDSKKCTANSSNFSELITKPKKCWSNEFYQPSKNFCWNEFFGVNDVVVDDNISEATELAVAAVWAVAIICFLAILFGTLLIVGMTILVLLSFQHYTSIKKSLKSQVRLLIVINRRLRRRSNFIGDVCSRTVIHDGRHHTRPLSRHSCHTQYEHPASNPGFHPRNNTPVSSCNDSFSSHASLSLSDLPSVSSFTPSVSEDVPTSEFTASPRVTTIHPVSARNFQRSHEEVLEREFQMREPRETVHSNYRMHDNRMDDLVLCTNGRRVNLQNCPPITSYEPIAQSRVCSPKEYWL